MAWWIWLIVAFAIGIVEVATFTFVLLWIALGAFVTAILSPLIGSVWGQLLLFAVVSAVLLVATRPLVRRWRQRRTYPERREAMIDKRGVVVKEAQPGAFAMVRVQGELWSARSGHPLRRGQAVVVRDATATVLTVEPAEEE
ncbi:NfeD family protein [Alicyclobacillus macrosporangiidus]|uniref:Membrane protein implicated in regulation of membrane protease activity n=1 Tax=Alicyclobacillus macrosporangiidus TaxID=392015 RepID=A0A1I7K0X1_9BACL|nr:NfeD family protein [Alicyclobacillus macrosporangiidus]SFU91041.1 Membrane protein implicated in regulation of membrane protease activity [Alicyclobacillus macrosporangiidus]